MWSKMNVLTMNLPESKNIFFVSKAKTIAAFRNYK